MIQNFFLKNIAECKTFKYSSIQIFLQFFKKFIFISPSYNNQFFILQLFPVVVGALFLLTTFCLLILRLLTISQHDVVVDGPLTDDLNDNRRTTAIIRHISAVPLTARQHEDRRRVLSNSATEAVALSERKPRHYSTPVYYSTQKRLPASRTEYCKRGAPAQNGLFTASKQTPRSKLQRFNFANVEADSGGPPCKPPERTECIHPLSAVRLIDIPAPRIRTIQNYTPSFISPKDKIWFF